MDDGGSVHRRPRERSEGEFDQQVTRRFRDREPWLVRRHRLRPERLREVGCHEIRTLAQRREGFPMRHNAWNDSAVLRSMNRTRKSAAGRRHLVARKGFTLPELIVSMIIMSV